MCPQTPTGRPYPSADRNQETPTRSPCGRSGAARCRVRLGVRGGGGAVLPRSYLLAAASK